MLVVMVWYDDDEDGNDDDDSGGGIEVTEKNTPSILHLAYTTIDKQGMIMDIL